MHIMLRNLVQERFLESVFPTNIFPETQIFWRTLIAIHKFSDKPFLRLITPTKKFFNFKNFDNCLFIVFLTKYCSLPNYQLLNYNENFVIYDCALSKRSCRSLHFFVGAFFTLFPIANSRIHISCTLVISRIRSMLNTSRGDVCWQPTKTCGASLLKSC